MNLIIFMLGCLTGFALTIIFVLGVTFAVLVYQHSKEVTSFEEMDGR